MVLSPRIQNHYLAIHYRGGWGPPAVPLDERRTADQTLHHSSLPDNLYLADASLLPRSMGNPPILTIMALAKKVARKAAQTVTI